MLLLSITALSEENKKYENQISFIRTIVTSKLISSLKCILKAFWPSFKIGKNYSSKQVDRLFDIFLSVASLKNNEVAISESKSQQNNFDEYYSFKLSLMIFYHTLIHEQKSKSTVLI